MRQLIRQLIFWLRGYRTVGPKQTPDIKRRTKQDAARLQ